MLSFFHKKLKSAAETVKKIPEAVKKSPGEIVEQTTVIVGGGIYVAAQLREIHKEFEVKKVGAYCLGAGVVLFEIGEFLKLGVGILQTIQKMQEDEAGNYACVSRFWFTPLFWVTVISVISTLLQLIGAAVFYKEVGSKSAEDKAQAENLLLYTVAVVVAELGRVAKLLIKHYKSNTEQQSQGERTPLLRSEHVAPALTM
jgi:hypothetical protein